MTPTDAETRLRELTDDDIRELWRRYMYPLHDRTTFDSFFADLTAKGWDEVRHEVAGVIAVVRALLPSLAPGGETPCGRCGGPCHYETGVSNEQWNRVIRRGGPEQTGEYLCAACVLEAFVLAGESFKAQLSGGVVSGGEIDVCVTMQPRVDSGEVSAATTQPRYKRAADEADGAAPAPAPGPTPGRDERCESRSPKDGFPCTQEKGHTGDHTAIPFNRPAQPQPSEAVTVEPGTCATCKHHNFELWCAGKVGRPFGQTPTTFGCTLYSRRVSVREGAGD